MSSRVPPVPSFPSSELTLTSLAGLSAAGVRAGIKASGAPDVALLVSDRPMACAGLFTRNAFAAAPVRVSQEHLASCGGLVRALVVNSGNANACTGARGEADAREMCARVAGAIACRPDEVLVCSTGVIGQPLPMERVRAGIDEALRTLDRGADAGRRFLAAIMTTDAFPKEASASAGGVQVAGICKGAGMIAPDMATMLAFVVTDAGVAPEGLRDAVGAIAAESFNAVHVDTHTSTNDTFLLLSTRGSSAATAPPAGWLDAVTRVARRLAWLIARDGEGATKVTTIQITGAASDEAARAIARNVAASALVRTALFGNDPNWGRFVSQAGNCPQLRKPEALRCLLQGVEVFARGEPVPFDRPAVSKAMAREDVSLELRLDEGTGRAVLMTSDLGYRYVEVNAEYTT